MLAGCLAVIIIVDSYREALAGSFVTIYQYDSLGRIKRKITGEQTPTTTTTTVPRVAG